MDLRDSRNTRPLADETGMKSAFFALTGVGLLWVVLLVFLARELITRSMAG